MVAQCVFSKSPPDPYPDPTSPICLFWCVRLWGAYEWDYFDIHFCYTVGTHPFFLLLCTLALTRTLISALTAGYIHKFDSIITLPGFGKYDFVF